MKPRPRDLYYVPTFELRPLVPFRFPLLLALAFMAAAAVVVIPQDCDRLSKARAFAGGARAASVEQIVPAPTTDAYVVGPDVTAAQAVQNRLAIEAPAPVPPPAGAVVKLDRAFKPSSGITFDGQGATILNGFDAATRTLEARGTGLGYFDTMTVTGDYQITLSDRTAAVYYRPGAPVYLWLLDGFQTAKGSLRTVRGVYTSRSGEPANPDPSTGVLALTPGGPPLDRRLTAAKWFTNGVYIGSVKAGVTRLAVSGGAFKPGDRVQVTEGPKIANEGREEWRRVVASDMTAVTLEAPVQRDYSDAVLAQAQPVVDVALKNVTLERPPAWAQIGTAQLNYANAWRLDGVTVRGAFFLSACSGWTCTNCAFDDVLLTACHGCTFIGCTFKTTRLEEASFDVGFYGCTWTGSLGANTACERLTLRGCRLTGAGSFMGITAPNSTLDALACDGAGFVALQGDGWTVRGSRGCPILLQVGSGVAIGCPGATVQAGNWKVLP